jgi:hypothetical protein
VRPDAGWTGRDQAAGTRRRMQQAPSYHFIQSIAAPRLANVVAKFAWAGGVPAALFPASRQRVLEFGTARRDPRLAFGAFARSRRTNKRRVTGRERCAQHVMIESHRDKLDRILRSPH